MKSPENMSKIAILVESALMIALAYVLSMIPLIQMPFGGTITCFSTLPLLMISFRHGGKWGLATALGFGFLQAMQGLSVILIVPTIPGMLLCTLLDYVFPYTLLGLAGPIAGRFSSFTRGLVVAVVLTGLARLFFSFLSGIILWGSYAPDTMPVWIYSLVYNASWSLPDSAIVLIALLMLSRVKVLHIARGKSA